MTVPDAVLRAMRQTNELFHTAVVAKGELQQIDHVYTVGARLLPPGAEMITGRDGIRAFWQQAIAGMGLQSARLTSVEAHMLGERVFEIGRADLAMAGGQNAVVKYVVLWQQEDGQWKWDVDIWNAS